MTAYLDRVKQIISMLFNIDEASLAAESSGDDVPAWDSMGQLMLILELEQQFDIQIPPERAAQLTSISKIASYLEEST
jgi:acyl carrier protein